ncbi:MAG TPA: type I restriction enzyme HsdR N-terminal domain-containing protein [Flavobacterium sp.]|nr:type I restriction enzyme HsdR N-terminal domain-containing protein [Flavobacterium sp.]
MESDFLEKHPIILENFNDCQRLLCKIRKSYINFTPEEKVRQSFLDYLLNDVKVPPNNIKLEYHTFSIDQYKGRVDILIEDDNGVPFIIYECKKEGEFFTNDVWIQALRYFTHFNTIEYIGFVIGNEIKLFKFYLEDGKVKNIELTNHPTYNELLYGNNFEYYVDTILPYERVDLYTKDEYILNQFLDYGLIGEGSSEKLYPFFINFYNWCYDIEDVFRSKGCVDLGTKVTAFGSATTKFAPNTYRSISKKINGDRVIFCFALSAVNYGKTIKTGIQVGVETIKTKRSSLQLNLDNSIIETADSYEIWHTGAITLGKKGASKRDKFISFVKQLKPDLVVNNKIYLGSLSKNEEMNSDSQSFINFIENLISYCKIRENYRNISS